MFLILQGNFASNFYIVEEGQLACIEVSKNKKIKKKTILGPEDHFGESSMILKSPLPFSVVSMSEATLWALDQETFSRVFSRNESLQKAIETLVEVTVFNSLDDSLFSDMILKSKLVKFAPGEVIATEDNYPAFFHVLQEGRVIVKNNWYTTEEDCELKFHKRLGIPGEFFGDFEICFGQMCVVAPSALSLSLSLSLPLPPSPSLSPSPSPSLSLSLPLSLSFDELS